MILQIREVASDVSNHQRSSYEESVGDFLNSEIWKLFQHFKREAQFLAANN